MSEGQLGYPPGSKVIEPLVLCPVRGFMSASSVEVTDKASQKKHRRTSSNVSLGPPSSLADTSRMSRRLRLIDFLADTRVIQRFIMVWHWAYLRGIFNAYFRVHNYGFVISIMPVQMYPIQRFQYRLISFWYLFMTCSLRGL